MKTEIHLTRMGRVVGSFSHMSPGSMKGDELMHEAIYIVLDFYCSFLFEGTNFYKASNGRSHHCQRQEHLPDVFVTKKLEFHKKICEVIKKATEPKARTDFRAAQRLKRP